MTRSAADPTAAGRVTRDMAEAARRFLDALGRDREADARLGFESPERVRWHYTPRTRCGISLAEMDRGQAKAAHRLLACGLSPPAYARAAAIIALEDVLDEREGGRRQRHAGDYWVAVFGEPGGEGPWGWRFEGHHLSVNLTVAGGSVSATPCFLGANPAAVADGTVTLLRPLGAEEERAYALLACLDEEQRRRAVVAEEAPADILTGEDPRTRPGTATSAGLESTALRPDQAARLWELVATYTGRLPDGVAEGYLARARAGPAVHFAWAGDVDAGPGHPHYYRLTGPGLLVELDNTQHGANHVHSVLRDPEGDFGADLL